MQLHMRRVAIYSKLCKHALQSSLEVHSNQVKGTSSRQKMDLSFRAGLNY